MTGSSGKSEHAGRLVPVHRGPGLSPGGSLLGCIDPNKDYFRTPKCTGC